MSIMENPNIKWDEPVTYNDLTNRQQDHLFYALDWARSAAREYYQEEFGTPTPLGFEMALATAYAEGLRDDSLGIIGIDR